MLSVVSAQPSSATAGPYLPSWVDRLTDFVKRLPVPPWLFYSALGIALSSLYLFLVLSSPTSGSGTFPITDAIFFSVLNGCTTAYLLGLVHYLDKTAAEAFARYRSVLKGNDADYDMLGYQLTTLPRRPTNIVTFIGVLYALASIFADSTTAAGSTTESFSVSLLVVIVIGVSISVAIHVFTAILVYHTLHQLRMVSKLYTEHTRINVFQLGPLYVLSGLTARTAIGISIITYIWFQADSSSVAESALINIIESVVLGALVIVTFVLPLVGAHTLLEREKQRLQDEVGRRMETTMEAMHASSDTSEMTDYAALKGVLDGLVVEQAVIEKLPTWPWRVETIRGLGVAFVLPVVIWIIQRLLERLGI